MNNNETHLSFQYDGEPLELVFPTAVHVCPMTKRLQPNVKKYIQSLGSKFGPITYIVDVGASSGLWAIPFTLYFPEAKILALEPSKYNYPYLQQNCKSYPNIKLMKMAASAANGKITIAEPSLAQRDRNDLDTNTGLISAYGQGINFREEVEADILDNLVESRVDWLKIDVEGHEMSVLEGARNILKRHRPLLQIEMRDQTQAMATSTTYLLSYAISSYNYVAAGAINQDWIFVPREKA